MRCVPQRFAIRVVVVAMLVTASVAGALVARLAARSLAVGAGTITANTTWLAADSPIDVTGVVVVGNGVSLTIEPGVTVRFASGSALQVDGTLIARGTEASPIRFTSNQAAVAPGQWGYVLLTDSAADATYDANGAYVSGSILEHVVIEGAGGTVPGSSASLAALRLLNSAPFVSHARVDNNRGQGVSVVANTLPAIAARIVDSTVSSNDVGIAMQMPLAGSSARVERTRVAQNRGRGIDFDGVAAVTVADNVIEDNRGDGFGTSSNRGALRLERNTVRRNDRGIYIINFAPQVSARVLDNTVQANSPFGGMWVEDAGYQLNVVEVRRNRFLKNTTSTGGAAAMTFRTYGPATIRDNVFAENTSTGRAIVSAAVFNNQATVAHNVMVRNQATRIFEVTISPSNLAFPAPALLENTIVDNRPTAAAQPAVYFTHTSGRPWIVTSNNIFNPLFGFELRVSLPNTAPAMDATNNWWSFTNPTAVGSRIYDQADSSTLATVSTDPVLTSPSTTAPLSPPQSVTVSSSPAGLRIDWLPNPESDIQGYRVFYDTHSGPDYANTIDVGAATTYTFASLPAGTYYVAIAAYDADSDGIDDLFDGNQSWYSAEVSALTTPTQPPLANAGGPYLAATGEEVTLDASASQDPDPGDAVALYEWDLNSDGVYDVTGATYTFVPAAAGLGLGPHTIRVRVTDGFGFTATGTTTLTVIDGRPAALFAASPNPAECVQAVQFDASSSTHSGATHQIVSYQWNFGDGATATGVNASHAYARFGTYNATLTVTDNNVPPQSASASRSIDVSLGNHPPTIAHNGPYTVILGAPLTLDARASTDADAACGDSIVSYDWTVGALTFHGALLHLTAQQVSSLGPPGTYPVTLTVTDGKGGVSVATTTLTTVNGTETITSDTTWRAIDSPIDVTKNLVIAAGVTLTIEPGVTARFGAGAALQVDGTIIARGTEIAPIRLTSAQAVAAPAQWGYVLLTDTAVDAAYDADGGYASGSIFEHVIIEGAGGAVVGKSDPPAALRLWNAAPWVSHARIENNRGPGISIVASAPLASRVLDSTVANNDEGISAIQPAPDSSLRIERNRVTQNRDRGISLVESYEAVVVDNVVEGNDGDGIGVYTNHGPLRIEGNTISGNYRGVYVVAFCCEVSTQVLENVVQDNTPLGAIVIDDSAYAMNTTDVVGNQVTGNTALTALGAGLYLRTAGAATVSENVISENTSTSRAIVSIFVSYPRPVTVSHNTITLNQAPKIFEGTGVPANTVIAAPALQDNIIADNVSTGGAQSAIHFTYFNGRHWLVSGNNIVNPTFAYELRHSLPAAAPAMDARNNWWGSADLQLIESRIYDQSRDPLLGIVDVDPVLSGPSPSAGVTPPDVRVDPVITWTPASLTYGTPLGAAQLNATADVPGTFIYSPAAGTPLEVGPAQVLQVTFTPDDGSAYHTVSATATVDVLKATQSITWTPQSPIEYGTALGGSQLNAVVTVSGPAPAGAVSYSPGAGTLLNVGTHTLTATVAETANYLGASASVQIGVDYPAISEAHVAPQSAVKGTGPIVLTITGHDFVPAAGSALGTLVSWNGVALPVAVVSRTELHATVAASLLANTGVAQIAVENPGAGRVVAPFFITDAPVTVSDAATGNAINGAVTISTPPLLAVTASGGGGDVSIAVYQSNPSSVFVAANAYFDVFVGSPAAFSSLTMTVCPPNGPSQILWFNGAAWLPVSNQVASGSCVLVTVDAGTSPSLAQLTGTYFASVIMSTGDTTAPVITATADRTSLWPPNGKLVPVTITGRATDEGSGLAAVRYRTTDQYGQVQPSGVAQVGASGQYSFVVQLPADRRGNDKAGRTFTVDVTATDAAGNAATTTVRISVPHDQRK